MNWRLQQRIFELSAVAVMLAGMVMMWQGKDPHHYFVYVGFVLLASGKLIEALNIHDPSFVIIKVSACVCMYLLVLLNLLYQVRSMAYLMIPLGLYYVLHYRWVLQQRKA